ncbi:MAG: hypothetical protein RMK99_14115 [Anaerolineales bacterium]|nr:hypothetical protein [Anaerolineales bacterium]
MTASVSKKRTPGAPAGVVASLIGGFEAVNARLMLALLPLLLDLWLWLGPRLSVKPLLEDAVAQLEALEQQPGDEAMLSSVQAMQETLLQMGESFNVFTYLSMAPLGLPSLMSSLPATATPFGSPIWWPISNPFLLLAVFGLLVLMGLWAGALYFGAIAQQVRDAKLDPARLLRDVWADWLRFVVLALIFAMVVAVIGFPALLLAGMLAQFNRFLGQLVIWAAAALAFSTLIFFGFTPHGIVYQRRGLFGALWDSPQLVFHNLSQTIGLYAVIMLIGYGLGLLWRLPGVETWWLAIGLGAHALTSTALLAATFVFYKDRYRFWVEAQATRRKLGDTRPNPRLRR